MASYLNWGKHHVRTQMRYEGFEIFSELSLHCKIVLGFSTYKIEITKIIRLTNN